VVKNTKGKLPAAFVFINPETKRHYTTKKLNQMWRTYSGTECDYYSASRHSFCTQIAFSGANQFDAQDLMRHADVRTTRKVLPSHI
jgi:site-specific recombinase XerD